MVLDEARHLERADNKYLKLSPAVREGRTGALEVKQLNKDGGKLGK